MPPALNLRSQSRAGLLHLAVACAAVMGLVELLVHLGPLGDVYLAYLFPADGALYVAAGLVAWRFRPANRLGSLMVTSGGIFVAASVANTAHTPLIIIGTLAATAPLSAMIHLTHASPTGRVQGAAARATVVGAYVVGLVLEVPIWAFTPEPPPFDVLEVAPHQDWAHTGFRFQQSIGGLVALITLVLLVRRLRHYDVAGRGLLAASMTVPLAAVALTLVGGDLLPELGVGRVHSVLVQVIATALVPLGFLAVVLRGGFAPVGGLTTLVSSVTGDHEVGLEALQLAIASALGDPDAQLLREGPDGFIDPAGRLVMVPAAGPHVALVELEAREECLGLIVYDPHLGIDPSTVTAVARVTSTALERERLTAELARSRRALREASARVVAATDQERRQVARDLHDGLQGRLVLLSLRARTLAQGGEGPEAAASLADDIDAAATTLRGLVEGVMPAQLAERGLLAAVQDLAGAVPVRVEVLDEGLRPELPPASETTAYFVVAEALTNVVKHAQAQRATVRLRCQDGDLLVSIADDGRGLRRSDHAPRGGTGLTGLRDRLSVVGGTLEIEDTGAGTVVRALLPCA